MLGLHEVNRTQGASTGFILNAYGSGIVSSPEWNSVLDGTASGECNHSIQRIRKTGFRANEGSYVILTVTPPKLHEYNGGQERLTHERVTTGSVATYGWQTNWITQDKLESGCWGGYRVISSESYSAVRVLDVSESNVSRTR